MPGTSASFVVDLVDPSTGLALTPQRLACAGVKLRVRIDPSGSDVLLFQTPDPTHLVLDSHASTLTINFTVADTNALTAGQAYFYQVELDLADGEVKLPIDWTPVDVTLGGSAATPPPPFASTVTITADYPLPGDMQYQTPGGNPIENAQVRVFLKSDYQCGKLNCPVGITTTDAFGKWRDPILVTPGFTYVARLEKAYAFGPDTKEFFA